MGRGIKSNLGPSGYHFEGAVLVLLTTVAIFIMFLHKNGVMHWWMKMESARSTDEIA